MEQHKVLLIIVSVTVVLAAVVGLGLWLFYPRADDETSIAQQGEPGAQGFEWQPLDYLQGEGEVPGLDRTQEPQSESDEFEVTYGVATDEREAGRPAVAPVIDTVPSGDGQSASGAEPQSDGQPGRAPATAATTDGTTSTRETVATPQQPPSRTAGSAGSGSTGRVAGAEPPAGNEGAELADRAYWVQAISSPNRDTIEQARLTLREHQLGSLILTKEIGGTTYFRLRVGPFAVRAEAEKFLGWVRAVSGFADAMIFVDYTTPVLAARPN